jgi:Flp pilus assembly protein TadB
MNPNAKKSIVATVGVAAACAACCAVPIAAAGGVVVAGPVGIVAVLLAGAAGLWAWLRGRAKRQRT